jgi:hypothetical protein
MTVDRARWEEMQQAKRAQRVAEQARRVAAKRGDQAPGPWLRLRTPILLGKTAKIIRYTDQGGGTDAQHATD